MGASDEGSLRPLHGQNRGFHQFITKNDFYFVVLFIYLAKISLNGE